MPVSTPRAGAALLVALSLLLAACLFAPGRFTSSLDLRKDGRFAFSYIGEIHMLALSKLAEDDERTFAPETCYREDGVEERPCSATDLAEQKRAW